MFFKEWLLKEELEIRGEYWIREDGWVDFADADVGDWSHEGIVINQLQHEIANEFNIEIDSDYIDWDEIEQQISELILDEWGLDNEKKQEYLSNYHSNEIIEKYFKNDKDNLEKLLVINGNEDARGYAIFKWNWKAVRGNFVETKSLNLQDFKTISHGLGEIIEEELGYEDEENLLGIEFSISIYPNGPTYNLTLAEIDAKASGMQPKIPQQRLQIDPIAVKNVAAQQAKQSDIEMMHPYYQQKKFPFGDWKL